VNSPQTVLLSTPLKSQLYSYHWAHHSSHYLYHCLRALPYLKHPASYLQLKPLVVLATFIKVVSCDRDCITVISDFSDTIPAHPLDILPHLASEPSDLASLLYSWPYFSHRFTKFHPYHTDGDPTELQLMARPHQTHVHTLEHFTFCYKRICPTHYPYGGNKRAK